MKQKLPGFLAGVLVTTLVGTLTVTALAASGKLTIDVYPINIQVNGTTFQPTDVNGNTVPVFTYNGTTYAPLRALANACGLGVGYDAEKNMATVDEKTAEDEKIPAATDDDITYQTFKDAWSISRTKITADNEILYDAIYSGSLNKSQFIDWWTSISADAKQEYAKQLAQEYQLKNKTYIAALYFKFSSTELGYAFCYENNRALASFTVNPFEIHDNVQ